MKDSDVAERPGASLTVAGPSSPRSGLLQGAAPSGALDGGAEAHGRPRRVLHLVLRAQLGGTEVLVGRLAEALRPLGVESLVGILQGTGGPAEALLAEQRVPCVRLGARHGRDPAAWARLSQLLRGFRPDVVHTHDARPWSLLLCRLLYRGPRVMTLHNLMPIGPGARRGRWVYRLARATQDVFVAVSRATLASVEGAVGVPRGGAVVILNGIPLDRFRRAGDRRELRARLGVSDTDPVVGMVGRLTAQKGVEDFLRAARAVAVRRPAVRFWIVGEGEEGERYEAMARDLGLSDRAVFWGNRTDVPDLMAALDLYLMTSRWEPFGLTLLEAMAANVPILGFLPALGGVEEVVRNGETACLLRERDPAALADVVVRYLDDAQARRRLAHAAAADVRARFDIRRMAASYARLYASLCGGR